MNHWISLSIGIVILLIAIPYVAHIRHPEQKPLAAYLIFLSAFVVAALVLNGLLVWLITQLEMGSILNRVIPAILFLLIMFLPAFFIARWLTRKPPQLHGPPG